MLLLLTLAFLAGPTCRAQEIWGNKVGTYFIIRGEEQGEIRGIKIYFTILSHIKGIQLLFGKHWSILYGMATASHKEWLLEDGEHIIKVRGDACLCLNSLTFITNKGNHVLFGKSQGRSFEDSGGPDKHLVTVNGMLLSGCISGIGFDWRHVPENVVSTTPQREPITIPNTSKPKERSKDEDKDGGDGGNDKDDDENNVRKKKNKTKKKKDDDDDDDDDDDE